MTFAENSTTHHSWTTDHLCSLKDLIERVETLQTLTVTRLVLRHVQMPFDHLKDQPESMMALSTLPDGILASLFRHKESLRILNIDFWNMSLERAKGLLETCTKLQRVQMSLDAPFAKLVSVYVFSMGSSAQNQADFGILLWC